MPFPSSFFPQLTSETPSKDTQSSPVGAGVASATGDEYFYFEKFIKWIQETKNKIPYATPDLRREAFEADPLLKGTVFPYLKNVLLQGFKIQTADNKLYAEAIKEITGYIESINLMQVFRDDFLDFFILSGHSYRRMDTDIDQNVWWLEKLEPSSMSVFTDPWDSSIVAYRQKALVSESWSDSGARTEHTSWFIPYQNNRMPIQIKDIYVTYINNRGTGNDLTVFDLFQSYLAKYNIIDTTNLRIASSERIIAMHKDQKTQASYYDNIDSRINYKPAPIDSILLAIWLKRLMLSNAPHLVYIVINPFLHAKSGILKEGKDSLGNSIITSSVPPKPSSALQASNPTMYNSMLENYNSWTKSIEEAKKHIMKTVKNGGVFASGPDLEIKPVESSRNADSVFIKNIIDFLNEEIGQALGFPMSLVLATGTELASSRNILQNFNNVHAGTRTEYESVADKLIRIRFEKSSWIGITTEEDKDGNEKEVQKPYTLKDIQAHFILDTPDTADLLNEAQAYKTKAETLTQLKGIGASTEDLQALGEEWGFGLLELGSMDIPVRDLLEMRNTDAIDDTEFRNRLKLTEKAPQVAD